MLRLVEDRHAALAERELGEQELVESVEELLPRSARWNDDPELREQRREHLQRVEERIEDQRRLRLLAIELLDEIATECRLARARAGRSRS